MGEIRFEEGLGVSKILVKKNVVMNVFKGLFNMNVELVFKLVVIIFSKEGIVVERYFVSVLNEYG